MSVQKDYHIEQSTILIEALSETGKNLGHATGIYLHTNHTKFLVTNWHVLSGKHPVSEKVNGETIPARIQITEIVGDQSYTIDLYDGENNPIWFAFEDKITNENNQKERIDVAIINLSKIRDNRGMPLAKLNGLMGMDIDINMQNVNRLQLQALDQICVIGFPYKRPRPIWKTCHIAESVQPSPKYFLANGRTKSGMSGSGAFLLLDSRKDSLVLPLVGIYAGRVRDTEPTTQSAKDLNDLDIGIIWKIDLVDKLIKKSLIVP